MEEENHVFQLSTRSTRDENRKIESETDALAM